MSGAAFVFGVAARAQKMPSSFAASFVLFSDSFCTSATIFRSFRKSFRKTGAFLAHRWQTDDVGSLGQSGASLPLWRRLMSERFLCCDLRHRSARLVLAACLTAGGQSSAGVVELRLFDRQRLRRAVAVRRCALAGLAIGNRDGAAVRRAGHDLELSAQLSRPADAVVRHGRLLQAQCWAAAR